MIFTNKYKNDMIIYSDYAEVILCDRNGNEKARTLIDLCDIELVGKHKWHELKGYVAGVNGIRLHRLIMNAPEGMVVDHINHNPLDNRRRNLRICTQRDNARNVQRSVRNTSGFKGVNYETKYRARIRDNNGRKLSLGYYENAIDAAIAYDKAAIAIHGEFAELNFDRSNYIVLTDGRVVTYEELINIVTDVEEVVEEELATEPYDDDDDEL